MGPPVTSAADGKMDRLGCSVFPYEFVLEDPQNSAQALVKYFRPDLREKIQSEPLKVKELTGGITNKLLVAYFESDSDDKVLIRVYGAETDKIIDRVAEVKTLIILHENNCGGKIYGVFDNGMCYEYVDGVPVELPMVYDVHISRLIIQELAQLHCIYRQEGEYPKVDIFGKMEGMYRMLPMEFDSEEQNKRFKKFYPDPEIFMNETCFLRKKLTEGNCQSPIVFCHNDLLCANILFDKRKDCVHFIDFEYAGLNFQAFDLANYFNEFAGVEDCDYNRFPDREYQINCLRHYLRCWNSIHGIEKKVEKEDVEKLYFTVNKFTLVSHLFWTIWSLHQAKYSTIDFDFLSYGKKRFDEYMRRKAEWLTD